MGVDRGSHASKPARRESLLEHEKVELSLKDRKIASRTSKYQEESGVDLHQLPGSNASAEK